MKTILALMLTSISINTAYAQFELFGAGVGGDSVKIWNTNIYTSCGAKYIASVQFSNDSIFVTELDTSTHHAVCSCYYDVNVSVIGLAPGNFHVVIYRQQLKKYQYPQDTLILVGSVTVPFAGSHTLLFYNKIAIGDCHQTPVSVEEIPIAGSYTLLASFPNPFNPRTTIRYSIARAEIVNLAIYDNLGRVITTLVNEKKASGEYNVRFDASSLPSGLYLCRLTAGTNVLTSKLVLLK
jgi:hypothetical protein